jgi:hypothetical protein
MNKQQRIVGLVRRAYENAVDQHRDAAVARAAAYAGAKTWDEYHNEDVVGPARQNPFDLNRVDQDAINARNYLTNMREAYEHAVDTFLGDN